MKIWWYVVWAEDAVRAYTPIGFQAGKREVLNQWLQSEAIICRRGEVLAWVFSQANLASSVLISR